MKEMGKTKRARRHRKFFQKKSRRIFPPDFLPGENDKRNESQGLQNKHDGEEPNNNLHKTFNFTNLNLIFMIEKFLKNLSIQNVLSNNVSKNKSEPKLEKQSNDLFDDENNLRKFSLSMPILQTFGFCKTPLRAHVSTQTLFFAKKETRIDEDKTDRFNITVFIDSKPLEKFGGESENQLNITLTLSNTNLGKNKFFSNCNFNKSDETSRKESDNNKMNLNVSISDKSFLSKFSVEAQRTPIKNKEKAKLKGNRIEDFMRKKKQREIIRRSFPHKDGITKYLHVKTLWNPFRIRNFEFIPSIVNFAEKRNKFFGKVRRLRTKLTSKSVEKLLTLCLWLGLTVKMGMRCVHASAKIKSRTLPSAESFSECKCEVYKSEIDSLSKKLDEMSSELSDVRQKLSQFEEVKKDLEDIKRELEILRKTKSTGGGCGNECNLISGGSPSPPPPPPPPPMYISVPIVRPRVLKKSCDNKVNEHSRPRITLDDILKVKLRKTADKPVPLKRTTQPLISDEMLSKIKLRPTALGSQTLKSD